MKTKKERKKEKKSEKEKKKTIMLENPYTIKYNICIRIQHIHTNERRFLKIQRKQTLWFTGPAVVLAFTLIVFASFAERGTLPIAEPCAQWGSNKRNCDIQDG